MCEWEEDGTTAKSTKLNLSPGNDFVVVEVNRAIYLPFGQKGLWLYGKKLSTKPPVDGDNVVAKIFRAIGWKNLARKLFPAEDVFIDEGWFQLACCEVKDAEGGLCGTGGSGKNVDDDEEQKPADVVQL